MRTLRAMTGMPIVCRGRRIGRMLLPELDAGLTRLEGLWISAGLGGTRFIPTDSLELLGSVSIHVDGPGRRRRMSAEPLFRRAISTDGRRLGAITGAEIDELTFRVAALELSRGLWDDLSSNRARVSRYTVDRETGEIIIESDDWTKEGISDEGEHDQGADHWDADRRRGGDDVRRHELEDGAPFESEGQVDRQLDLGPRQ